MVLFSLFITLRIFYKYIYGVYIVRIDCKLGKQNHEGFAYLGYDVDRASDEAHKAVKRLADKKLTDEQFKKILDSAGLFVIVSSLPY